MKRNLFIVGAVVAAVLLIDQIVKVWVKTTFHYYDPAKPIFGDWFQLVYIENQGMAFGTTFGSSVWAKLGLSVFRVFAIIGIAYYWYKQAQKGVRRELLIAIGFIFAGATGNLIDSMFYDFIFPYDPCISFNHLEHSGVISDCQWLGKIETRHTGFLMGNVVDMFKFNMIWPNWMPWVGGSEVFPAIWNIADSAITVGVVMIILRQRAYFGNNYTEAEAQKELEGMRKTGLYGGIAAILLFILLGAKLYIVPAGYETMAFYGVVVIYLLSIYVTSRLANLENRPVFPWVLGAIVVPFLPMIALSRMERLPGRIVVTVPTSEQPQFPNEEVPSETKIEQDQPITAPTDERPQFPNEELPDDTKLS